MMASFSISVEPLLFILTFTVMMYQLSYNIYIFRKVAETYNLTSANLTSDCLLVNNTDSTYAKVSAETSQWSLKISLAGKGYVMFLVHLNIRSKCWSYYVI